jgi:hypothetical protein
MVIKFTNRQKDGQILVIKCSSDGHKHCQMVIKLVDRQKCSQIENEFVNGQKDCQMVIQSLSDGCKCGQMVTLLSTQ